MRTREDICFALVAAQDKAEELQAELNAHDAAETVVLLTRCKGFYRAYYSDGTSLIIHANDARKMSNTYNIRIEDEDGPRIAKETRQ